MNHFRWCQMVKRVMNKTVRKTGTESCNRRQVVSPRPLTGRSQCRGPSPQHCGVGAGGEWRSEPEGYISPCCHDDRGPQRSCPALVTKQRGGSGDTSVLPTSVSPECWVNPTSAQEAVSMGLAPSDDLLIPPGVRCPGSRKPSHLLSGLG